MHVEAIYEEGRLIFKRPIRLRKGRVEVRVIVPDKEIMAEEVTTREEVSGKSTRTSRLVARLRSIRGEVFSYRDNGKSDKERFSEELELSGEYR